MHRAVEAVVMVLVAAALFVLPWLERRSIAEQCRSVGAVKLDGAVFRCKEKPPKP